MYNGIGLTTARGSGTNGFVQRNLSFVRKHKDRVDYKTEEEINKLDQSLVKKPNREILDHERKRKVELKCMEMHELMEEQGYPSDEIEKKVSTFRKMLMEKEGVSDTVDKDDFGRPIAKETHQIAEANEEKNARLKAAFGLSNSYVDGSSFDPDRKAKEQAAKAKEEAARALAMAQKNYSIVRDSSSDSRSPSPVKKKKKSREESSSPERKSKKKKSKKHRSERTDSRRHKHDRERRKHRKKSHHESSEKKSKKRRRREESSSSDSDSDSGSQSDGSESSPERTSARTLKAGARGRPADKVRAASPESSVSPNPVRSKESSPPRNGKRHKSRSLSYSPAERHKPRDTTPPREKVPPVTARQRSPSPVKEARPRSLSPKRSAESQKSREKGHRRSRSRSYSPKRSRSRSLSYSPSKRRKRSKSYSPEKRRNRSRSRSHRRSYSRERSRSASHSKTPARSRDSRSPSIRRRRGSPSHLDKRRITSARKRPVPYYRPTPPSPSSVSSSGSFRGSRSPIRTRFHSRSRSRTRNRSWSYDIYSRR